MKPPEKAKIGAVHAVYLPSGESTLSSCVLGDGDVPGVGAIAVGPAIHVRDALSSGWGAVLLVAKECNEHETVPGLIFHHPVEDHRAVALDVLNRAFAEAWVAMHSRCGLLIACGSGKTRAPVFAAGLLRFLECYPTYNEALDFVAHVHDGVGPKPRLSNSVGEFVDRRMHIGAGVPFPFSKAVLGRSGRRTAPDRANSAFRQKGPAGASRR